MYVYFCDSLNWLQVDDVRDTHILRIQILLIFCFIHIQYNSAIGASDITVLEYPHLRARFSQKG